MINILVLDDSDDLLEAFKTILEMSGYDVRATNKKDTFLQELENRKPDLIFLDINLGDADGREICKDLKEGEDTKNIPVILFSATPAKLQSYKECKADDIIEKPFSIYDVRKKIESLLMVKS